MPNVTRTLGRRRLLVLAGAVLVWPSQYRNAPQQVRDAYVWAAMHENILRYVPCFCGCGADGHKNNFDCFVESRQTGGWITMDLHGLNCGTCVAITLESAHMTEKGLTVRLAG